MLTKMLKKDFQATARYFIPLIIGFMILSVVCKILFEIRISSAFQENERILPIIIIVFMSLYIFYIIGYVIMTTVFIVIDFYKTMVGEQGYLTHTLPVKTSTLIQSKILISALWRLISVLLIVLSIALFFIGHIHELFNSDMIVINAEFGLGINWVEFIFFIIALAILELLTGPLMYFACIAIGHLFGKHRIVGAVASYLALSTIMQILSAVVMVATGYFFYDINSLPNVSFYMWFSIILALVTGIGFYIITEYVFRKKLNLE